MVARGGVEPPTFRFSVGRSYQLSYLAVRAGFSAQRRISGRFGPRGDGSRRDLALRCGSGSGGGESAHG